MRSVGAAGAERVSAGKEVRPILVHRRSPLRRAIGMVTVMVMVMAAARPSVMVVAASERPGEALDRPHVERWQQLLRRRQLGQ